MYRSFNDSVYNKLNNELITEFSDFITAVFTVNDYNNLVTPINNFVKLLL